VWDELQQSRDPPRERRELKVVPNIILVMSLVIINYPSNDANFDLTGVSPKSTNVARLERIVANHIIRMGNTKFPTIDVQAFFIRPRFMPG
jgi:ABC-type glucose/galactose transport system permease subunit